MKTETLDLAVPATDSDLIAAIRDGHCDRFGEIVERYQRMLYAVAWSRLRRSDLAEDVVQETFLQAYRYLPVLRDPSRLPGWMARIARNLAIRLSKRSASEDRRMRQWGESMPAGPTSDSGAGEATAIEVNSALARIPDKYREALVLFHVEEKSTRQCAEILGISEAALRTRLHRARIALRSQMQETIESELRQLGSDTNMKSKVMAAIPAVPMLGGGIGGGAAGFALLPYLLQFIPFGVTFGMVGWFNSRMARNFARDREVRTGILRRNYVTLMLTVGVLVALTLVAGHRYGTNAVFAFLGALMGVTSYAGYWQWRHTNNRFIGAMAIANAIVAAAFIIVCLADLPPLWVMPSFLVMNVIIFHVRESRPNRMDYNLFQRAAMGQLAGRITEPKPVPAETLVRFGQFLGENYLISWQSPTLSGRRFYLNPISPSPAQAMLPAKCLLSSMSWVDIARDGQVTACLSPGDERSLHRITSTVEIATVTALVEQAMASAVADFAVGNRQGALASVQQVTDEEIHAVPPHKLRSQKIFYAIGIIAGIYMLIFCFLFSDKLRQAQKAASRPEAAPPAASTILRPPTQSPDQSSRPQP
ncbi:MAG: sigma-70 family RNA polymerase sigma factor [Candidatus Sumerlaeaceae bacterium]|nr:sigma-70 family RNA polymerase sigma factor [Candidatus Sumerlaeaceae bacterium]